jgi:hypothetical protein
MGKSKGIKTSKSGFYWVNIILSTGKYKLVIAELIDKEVMLFRVWSNSSVINTEPKWTHPKEKNGWAYLDLFEDEINEFFNYIY